MRTITVSEPVWEEIAKQGKFGETEDDVLRRVFKLPPNAGGPGQSPSAEVMRHRSAPSQPRRQMATRRMSSYISANQLHVSFDGNPSRSWPLPPRTDKAAIRAVRDKAVAFARENAATLGQVNAVKKTLTDTGYHLIK